MKSDHNIHITLLLIASISLIIAGIIFLCISLFKDDSAWSLPSSLSCIALSGIFSLIYRQLKHK